MLTDGRWRIGAPTNQAFPDPFRGRMEWSLEWSLILGRASGIEAFDTRSTYLLYLEAYLCSAYGFCVIDKNTVQYCTFTAATWGFIDGFRNAVVNSKSVFEISSYFEIRNTGVRWHLKYGFRNVSMNPQRVSISSKYSTSYFEIYSKRYGYGVVIKKHCMYCTACTVLYDST